jgi:hypothetical protein
MTKHFYNPIIERINNHGCTTREVAWLVDLFAYEIVKRLSVTMQTEAKWDDLTSVYGAKQRDIEQFSLRVERKNIGGREQWLGLFEHDYKRLQVIVAFES